MTVWRHFNVPAAGYGYSLSEALCVVDQRFPHLLWPVNEGMQVVLSDYSGQHRHATHEAYSFLVSTRHDIETWLPRLELFREQWLPDGRRLSFKQLREPMRRRAYPHFLDIAGELRANLITFMIDRRVGSFIDGGPTALVEGFGDCFEPEIRPGSIEKVYRLALFTAMLQAGLRDERQSSIWISDHDEALETFRRRDGFARLTSYLTYGLTKWTNPADHRFCTTENPSLPKWVEDLAAIPDMAAGASAILSNDLPTFSGTSTWVTRVRPSDELDWRARMFYDWLALSSSSLRHVLLRLEPDQHSLVRASAQQVRAYP